MTKDTITITNKKIISINNEEANILLSNILLHFTEPPLLGVMRADYLLEMLKDYKKHPNGFSIARKLDKYKQINNHNGNPPIV